MHVGNHGIGLVEGRRHVAIFFFLFSKRPSPFEETQSRHTKVNVCSTRMLRLSPFHPRRPLTNPSLFACTLRPAVPDAWVALLMFWCTFVCSPSLVPGHWSLQQQPGQETSSVLSDESVLTQWSVSTQRSMLSVGDFPPVRDASSPNR